MARYKPDKSYQGYGDDYYNWGCKLIMDDDRCLHIGPNGEIFQGDKKNNAYEIERDNLQRMTYLRMVKGNPTMWFVYLIAKPVVHEENLILQVEEAYRLMPDNSIKPIPILFKYPGNIYELCTIFDIACKSRSAANFNLPPAGTGRVVPDYGKKQR
jgi:hypothetical protein